MFNVSPTILTIALSSRYCFSALLLKSCHSFQYPLEGCKNKKTENVFEIVELYVYLRHLYP